MVLKMTFIDLFAGIGGFRRGLELAGHKCIGFCEWDKYATASYISMHCITEKQREFLKTLNLKERRKEILKSEYLNGEWYANDIRNVNAWNIPKADCWTFGAPCQDFSIAGKRAGLAGERSSLIQEVFRILEELKEENKPEWLIYENVKGMFSSNRGLDYLSIVCEMDRLGYNIEWQNINSKWFVPQNRERIYTIGHLRNRGRAKIFPIKGTNGENNILQIASVPNKTRENPNPGRTYSTEGISPCLSTMDGGNLEPRIGIKVLGITQPNRHSTGDIHDVTGIMSTCLSRDCRDPKLIAIPVLTPDRAEKRQNGRRFKENGDPMFTLTAQDRHGVVIDLKAFSSKTRGQPFRYGYAATLDHNCNQGIIIPVDNQKDTKCGNAIYIEMPEGFMVYAVWYEKEQCYIAIRRLTPKECFRLQGWTDDYFEKAAFVNSDSQLYKQAGNGVTVNVVQTIGERIKKVEKGTT